MLTFKGLKTNFGQLLGSPTLRTPLRPIQPITACPLIVRPAPPCREETKGRFRKRVVLANVPSFWFLVPGNIRMYLRSVFWYQGTSECTLVPCFGTGEHPPKPPFWKPPFCEPATLVLHIMQTYLCNTPFCNTLGDTT